MVLFNYSTKEITAKIVYYGPGLCGKTTNLQFIYDDLPGAIKKGKMLSLATKTDRTLFFDFLPIDLGTIRGMRTRLQLYTVPGQVFYNTTRKLVLKGADGIVFVADSQNCMLDANIESLKNLEQNLAEHDMDLMKIPLILQFNKRDLPDVATTEKLNATLNQRNVPIYEAVATTGIGVHETLKAMTRLVLNSLKERYADKRRQRPSALKSAAAMSSSGTTGQQTVGLTGTSAVKEPARPDESVRPSIPDASPAHTVEFHASVSPKTADENATEAPSIPIPESTGADAFAISATPEEPAKSAPIDPVANDPFAVPETIPGPPAAMSEPLGPLDHMANDPFAVPETTPGPPAAMSEPLGPLGHMDDDPFAVPETTPEPPAAMSETLGPLGHMDDDPVAVPETTPEPPAAMSEPLGPLGHMDDDPFAAPETTPEPPAAMSAPLGPLGSMDDDPFAVPETTPEPSAAMSEPLGPMEDDPFAVPETTPEPLAAMSEPLGPMEDDPFAVPEPPPGEAEGMATTPLGKEPFSVMETTPEAPSGMSALGVDDSLGIDDTSPDRPFGLSGEDRLSPSLGDRLSVAEAFVDPLLDSAANAGSPLEDDMGSEPVLELIDEPLLSVIPDDDDMISRLSEEPLETGDNVPVTDDTLELDDSHVGEAFPVTPSRDVLSADVGSQARGLDEENEDVPESRSDIPGEDLDSPTQNSAHEMGLPAQARLELSMSRLPTQAEEIVLPVELSVGGRALRLDLKISIALAEDEQGGERFEERRNNGDDPRL